MSNEKLKTRGISWRAVVDQADPRRKEPKTAYVFSNKREFRESTPFYIFYDIWCAIEDGELRQIEDGIDIRIIE